jgi:hypothetical protein
MPILLLALALADEPNWPQWRGPQRNGVSSATGLPLEWSAEKNVLWKTAIEGRGHSSPVIWGDRVFLTTDIEGEKIVGASAPEHVRDGEVYLHPDSQSGDRRHTLKVIALSAVEPDGARRARLRQPPPGEYLCLSHCRRRRRTSVRVLRLRRAPRL